MDKEWICFISGVILILLSLWGGSYFIHLFTEDSWMFFPTVMTSILTFLAGVVLALTADIY